MHKSFMVKMLSFICYGHSKEPVEDLCPGNMILLLFLKDYSGSCGVKIKESQ